MEHRPLSDSLSQQISEYVTDRIGLHFPRARWPDLQRGLAGAMTELGFPDLTSGAEWLLSAPLTKAELDVLASHLTIGETYFFREKKTFDVLREKILPQMVHARRNGERRLRIWSAACCTGEEPYSLAILLEEVVPDLSDWHVTILATDLNVRFLKKAIAGVYREWSFRETPASIKDRYFKRTADGSYEILPEIKRLVTFVQLNLVEDAFPSLVGETNAMDLIFCRNVLMYFSPAQARKVVSNLYRALVNHGWLLVSPSETSQVLFKQFVTVNFPGVILYKRELQHDQPRIPATIDDPPVHFDCAVNSIELQTSVSAERAGADSKSFSELTRALADQGKLTDALHWCDRWVEAEKLDSLAHYVRAIVLQELGDAEQARRSLQTAIYLDPAFVLAHFTLGGLARAQGKLAESRRHFVNALSLLDRFPADEVLPEADGLTAGRLTEIIKSITLTEEAP